MVIIDETEGATLGDFQAGDVVRLLSSRKIFLVTDIKQKDMPHTMVLIDVATGENTTLEKRREVDLLSAMLTVK